MNNFLYLCMATLAFLSFGLYATAANGSTEQIILGFSSVISGMVTLIRLERNE